MFKDQQLAVVNVQNLRKHYTIHEKEPGFIGSVRSFVNRKFKQVEAVKDISFQLASGEIVGFLGPNGAGKTTTLKMLSGLLHPSGGQVLVAGYEPRKRENQFLRQMTLVMGQKQQLMWDLPALDSFLVNQAIYEIPDDEYQATMREFTEVLSLDGILKKQVRKLSLGERMKCELAAALLHKPKILFLDEPTIGLDVNMQEAVREFVKEYNDRYNATIILTSHYMADVTALARRILVIDQGSLVFDGDLSKLAEQSQNGKTIKLQLHHPVSSEYLKKFGRIIRNDGLSIEMNVPRAEVSKRAAILLADLDVADLTVEDPPIETVMAELFGRQETPLKDSQLQDLQEEKA